MSSGLIISETVSWIVAGWAGRNAIEGIIQKLDPASDEELIEALREAFLYSGSLADVSGATDEQMRCLFDAAQRARATAVTEGSDDWARPEFYPGFMDRFTDLIDRLRADPRVSNS